MHLKHINVLLFTTTFDEKKGNKSNVEVVSMREDSIKLEDEIEFEDNFAFLAKDLFLRQKHRQKNWLRGLLSTHYYNCLI